MLDLGIARCGLPTMMKSQVPGKPYQFVFTIRLNQLKYSYIVKITKCPVKNSTMIIGSHRTGY